MNNSPTFVAGPAESVLRWDPAKPSLRKVFQESARKSNVPSLSIAEQRKIRHKNRRTQKTDRLLLLNQVQSKNVPKPTTYTPPTHHLHRTDQSLIGNILSGDKLREKDATPVPFPRGLLYPTT